VLCAAGIGCGDDDESADAGAGRADAVRQSDDAAVEDARAAEPAASEGAAGAGSPSTLVVAVRRLPRTLDPLGDLEPWGQRIVDDLVFEGLVRRDGDAAPFVAPALAERCELVPAAAPRHAWCRLRERAAFHDGEPVTVDDVLWSLRWWLDPRRDALRMRAGLGALERVDVAHAAPVDGTPPGVWIHLSFSAPSPLMLEAVAAMKVVPKARRRSGSAFGRAPVGTGPMRVVSFENDRIVLERAASSSGAREAALEGVVVREVESAAQGLTLLRRGDVHVLGWVARAHLPGELAKPGMDPRFTAWLLTPPWADVVVYNTRRSPLGGRRLREALDLSLPRLRIAEEGRAMPSSGAATPIDVRPPTPIDLLALQRLGRRAQWGEHGLPAPGDPQAHERARERAAKALDELGWRMERGSRRRGASALRLPLMWDGAGGAEGAAVAALRESWRSLGVQLPNVSASFAYLFGLMRKGEFDVTIVRLALSPDADPHPYFHSHGELNLSGLADAEVDAAVEAFRAATDRAARDEARRRLADRLAELVPMSVLYAPTEVMLVSRRVEGLAFADDLPRLDALRLGPEFAWDE
jgi:ABC-type transport system substrate-binding protein